MSEFWKQFNKRKREAIDERIAREFPVRRRVRSICDQCCHRGGYLSCRLEERFPKARTKLGEADYCSVEPPENCPYVLEHVLKLEGEIEDDDTSIDRS